jgi:hypothetical protein
MAILQDHISPAMSANVELRVGRLIFPDPTDWRACWRCQRSATNVYPENFEQLGEGTDQAYPPSSPASPIGRTFSCPSTGNYVDNLRRIRIDSIDGRELSRAVRSRHGGSKRYYGQLEIH